MWTDRRPVEQHNPLLNQPKGRETLACVRAAIARKARAVLCRRAARAYLALPLLAGAAWFVRLALHSGAVALGVTPAHGFANTLAAILLTPALGLCVMPLLDASLALLCGRDTAERWCRIMVEAGAALIIAACATVTSAALWPGVTGLSLVTALGFVAGFLRWHPAELVAREPSGLPLLLILLDDRPEHSSASSAPAAQVPSESQAA